MRHGTVVSEPTAPLRVGVSHRPSTVRRVTPDESSPANSSTDASSTVPTFDDEALATLRTLVDATEAEFRAGQLEAIEALVVDRVRVLVVQRTGWGKSAVYFVATRLLRDRGAGPTVIVSPLLALMRNQIAAGERGGITTATINSNNRDEWDEIAERLDRDEIDVLLISPERFANAGFRDSILPTARAARRFARRRRGALHQRLGSRLPARLSPHGTGARTPAGRRAGARHHRDGERPGRRRYRVTVRREHAHHSRVAGSAEPRARHAAHAEPTRPTRVALDRDPDACRAPASSIASPSPIAHVSPVG